MSIRAAATGRASTELRLAGSRKPRGILESGFAFQYDPDSAFGERCNLQDHLESRQDRMAIAPFAAWKPERVAKLRALIRLAPLVEDGAVSEPRAPNGSPGNRGMSERSAVPFAAPAPMKSIRLVALKLWRSVFHLDTTT